MSCDELPQSFAWKGADCIFPLEWKIFLCYAKDTKLKTHLQVQDSEWSVSAFFKVTDFISTNQKIFYPWELFESNPTILFRKKRISACGDMTLKSSPSASFTDSPPAKRTRNTPTSGTKVVRKRLTTNIPSTGAQIKLLKELRDQPSLIRNQKIEILPVYFGLHYK